MLADELPDATQPACALRRPEPSPDSVVESSHSALNGVIHVLALPERDLGDDLSGGRVLRLKVAPERDGLVVPPMK